MRRPTWRHWRRNSAAPRSIRTGPRPLHIAQLTREIEKLKRRLENAMLVIDVQKKLAALMGITLDENGERI